MPRSQACSQDFISGGPKVLAGGPSQRTRNIQSLNDHHDHRILTCSVTQRSDVLYYKQQWRIQDCAKGVRFRQGHRNAEDINTPAQKILKIFAGNATFFGCNFTSLEQILIFNSKLSNCRNTYE